MMGLPLLAYAALVHLCTLRRLPKPLVTAVFFAGIVVLPAWRELGEGWRLLPAAVLFAAVCWLNGRFIESWEAELSISLSVPVPGVTSTSIFGAVSLVTALVDCVVQPGVLPAACSLSVALLLFLNASRNRLGGLHLRALADAALLTPLLFLLPVF